MSTAVLLKKSSVTGKIPLTTDLNYGELALNYADGKLYFKDSSNTIQSFASLTATATLTNKTLTSPTLTTPSVSGLLSVTVTTTNNGLSVSYNPTTTNGAAAFLSGSNSQGGTGYFDFLKATNTSTGATNATKSIRLDSSGTLQIINSAYSANIFNLTDAGALTVPSITNPVLTGSLTVGGNTGSNGQFLKSTGTGVVWATPGGSSLASLSDVSLATPTTNQVLTFNGANWVNAAPNVQIASAVFASSAYDMGYVYDVASTSEDEGLVTGSSNYIYDLGILSFTGIISLNNIDQSIKSDYLGYSIIFGF